MRTIGEAWDRQCPDCKSIFASVQSTGVCPSCNLVFDVDREGKPLSRRHRIGDGAAPKLTPTEAGVKQVRKYARFLEANKITFEEFSYNLLLFWVELPAECWEACAWELPDEVVRQFTDYLDEYLIPLQYRPCPTWFINGPVDSQSIEQKTTELEPRYRDLHDFWRRHLDKREITLQ